MSAFLEPASDPRAQLERALELCFRLLAPRDRTVAEVRRHLEHRRVKPAGIAAAIADLARQGYLDDARFARRFADDRRRLDAWGAGRIERRLVALGVEPALAAAAAREVDEHDERSAAVALLRRRLPRAPRSDRERERALGLLLRRGYELELAYAAVRDFEADA